MRHDFSIFCRFLFAMTPQPCPGEVDAAPPIMILAHDDFLFRSRARLRWLDTIFRGGLVCSCSPPVCLGRASEGPRVDSESFFQYRRAPSFP
jgi:hypothetical protein